MIAVVLGTIGAGLGLSAGVALNVRLAQALRTPIAATLVNFIVGGTVLTTLWLAGVDPAVAGARGAPWMYAGGLLGVAYVSSSLVVGGRLGIALGTIAVTLGQITGALVIAGFGLLGQAQRAPSFLSLGSALLLVAAVALLASDRARMASGTE